MVHKHGMGLDPDSDAAEALVIDGPQDKHATESFLGFANYTEKF